MKNNLCMAGLYVHIPFCKSRCVYCGFYSTTLSELQHDYVAALRREMELRRGYIAEPWRSIYIGGGTPSQLPPALLEELFDAIDTSQAVEVTLECNPDDITTDYAALIGRLPVNRISMGAQTFSDDRLRFLHRRHNAAEVATAVERLRSVGIENVSVDLMYGFPGETLDDWRSDIAHAIALGCEHLSAYCLMYEEGTHLYNMLRDGKVKEADEETQRTMYYELKDKLAAAGYNHYEISNFARSGRRSLHNSGYWRLTPYMGIGAAAHSYDGKSRQWNVADVMEYIKAIENGDVPAERESLDTNTHYNDTVMLALRTSDGLDLTALERSCGHKLRRYCESQAQTYINSGLLIANDGCLRLSREGLFVSDMVASDLMAV